MCRAQVITCVSPAGAAGQKQKREAGTAVTKRPLTPAWLSITLLGCVSVCLGSCQQSNPRLWLAHLRHVCGLVLCLGITVELCELLVHLFEAGPGRWLVLPALEHESCVPDEHLLGAASRGGAADWWPCDLLSTVVVQWGLARVEHSPHHHAKGADVDLIRQQGS